MRWENFILASRIKENRSKFLKTGWTLGIATLPIWKFYYFNYKLQFKYSYVRCVFSVASSASKFEQWISYYYKLLGRPKKKLIHWTWVLEMSGPLPEQKTCLVRSTKEAIQASSNTSLHLSQHLKLEPLRNRGKYEQWYCISFVGSIMFYFVMMVQWAYQW